MKLFIDSANLEEIKKVAKMGMLGGVTTNPTLLVKQLSSGDSFADSKTILEEICKIIPVDILAEPISTDHKNIVKESIELAKISNQIVAKIPISDEGLIAVKELKQKNIKTAFTLIFSISQALLSAAAGADYICPFVGRLDDIGQNGMELIKNIVGIYKNYDIKTKVIVASVRSISHVTTSALYGADAVTAPYKIIEEMLKHELTDMGIQKFLDDWSKIEKKI